MIPFGSFKAASGAVLVFQATILLPKKRRNKDSFRGG